MPRSGLKLRAPFAASVALLAAACSRDEASRGIDPPLPPDVTRTLTEADDGGAVSLAVGDTIAVVLVGVPTAGYVWEADAVPGFLTPGEPLSGPTSRAQLQPGFTGGSHWEVLVFSAAGPGEGRLSLVQRRSWEENEPPADTFTVDVEVK
jgi:predicted secreted protein